MYEVIPNDGPVAQWLPACRQAGSKALIKLMPYTIYRLHFEEGGTYIGMTENLQRRLYEHERGKTKSTKNRNIILVESIEICENRSKAREREKYWKSGAGREKLKKGQ